MNKQQIKAELRRSACESVNIIINIHIEAWMAVVDYQEFNLFYADDIELRTFYLLVAEAL